jgi:integrase
VTAAAQAHRNAARWTVAMAVGLRQSEALALRWADIDLEQGTLTVHRGVHRVRGQGLVYEEPKADRGRRTLALQAPLVEALRAHRDADPSGEAAASQARSQPNRGQSPRPIPEPSPAPHARAGWQLRPAWSR